MLTVGVIPNIRQGIGHVIEGTERAKTLIYLSHKNQQQCPCAAIRTSKFSHTVPIAASVMVN